MYDNEKSRYCYPNSEVLINIPGFKEQKQLDAFERIVSTDRLRILGLKPLKGNFNLIHLCAIHKFIFKDIYPFAGKLREEDISKGHFGFAHVRFLVNQTHALLNELKQENYLKGLAFEHFINRLTFYTSELNVLHPFREGNGRTQREFLRCLALESDYLIDWTRVDASTMLKVMIHSPYDDSALRTVLHTLITESNIK
jgi:cell filamentation protein